MTIAHAPGKIAQSIALTIDDAGAKPYHDMIHGWPAGAAETNEAAFTQGPTLGTIVA